MSEENKSAETKPAEPPKNIYLAVYDPKIEETEIFKTLTSTEGTKAVHYPYVLEGFVLRPTTDENNFNMVLTKEEKTHFGVVCCLYEINVENLKNSHSNIFEELQLLKEVGDLREFQEPEFKYLYKVASYLEKDVVTLTKNNTLFSGNGTQNTIDRDVIHNNGTALVESFFKYYEDKLGKNVALNALNYLEEFITKTLNSPITLIHSYISNLPRTDTFEYPFQKGSMEKIEYEVELDKHSKDAVRMIPTFKPETGNFDWDKPKVFLKHFPNSEGKVDIGIGD